jgi:hypothetical protein
MGEVETLTLAGFLLARIAEDEAGATAVKVREAEGWMADCGEDHDLRIADDRSGWEIGPARVLAECAAKRRIVEWHANWPVLVQTEPSFGGFEPALVSGPMRVAQRLAWLTGQEYRARFGDEPPTGPILQFLALPYADHPDYDETWRP